MKLFIVVVFCFCAAWTAAGQAPVITAADLDRLTGPSWAGTLTYVDYSSNKRTSIRSNLTVTKVGGDSGAWRFAYEYPDEPKANQTSDAVLASGGKNFFGEDVVEKTKLADGSLRFVTTQRGTDNDKPALFRYTYLIARNSLSIKKEVRIDGSKDFFERNVYEWKR
jgi:hypothetical protein